MSTAAAQPRTYEVRTYGCQMNVHDSERLGGLLEGAGYVAAVEGEQADVVVFNTCAVRENADNRLYGNLGHLAPVKAARPGMQIAVGGCLAQKDRDTITRRAPWVDVVFGTHNIGSLPVLLERARVQEEAQVEILESLEVFPSTLPTKRESAYAAWVSVSVGCNNTCTFCIVPSLRGKEKDRRPGEILAEIQALVAEGVSEITLLGQNVNSYGVEFGDRQAFSKLLRACGDIDGLERVRFTSPHPAEFTDDVIEAMAQTPNVMPQLHMPLQSGSDRVLKAMRRSYRQSRYLGIIDRVRAAMPEAAITTDIIVGFPGETEEDFQATLDVVRQARFSGAFTFQYSKRPGTPAATLEDQVPPAVVTDRYNRLVELVNEIAWEENKALVGREVELMVAEGEGKKDAATHRLSGRGPDNRLVHFEADFSQVSRLGPGGPRTSTSGDEGARPGDLVTVGITYAAPHHLVADGPVRALRRTRSGDAWEARQGKAAEARAVGLGMPAVGVPAPLPDAPVCG
ncbi:MAG TPA: tRNA (N6-isopentenyl adenosine(37)-C2)-methylthiotransferase MiaB [Nocardioides sp.]|nr:tRNA (N6-isopentenyl adenosine(37)-C2)-methylthiotransferase MiaB [Nocardioides sp.]